MIAIQLRLQFPWSYNLPWGCVWTNTHTGLFTLHKFAWSNELTRGIHMFLEFNLPTGMILSQKEILLTISSKTYFNGALVGKQFCISGASYSSRVCMQGLLNVTRAFKSWPNQNLTSCITNLTSSTYLYSVLRPDASMVILLFCVRMLPHSESWNVSVQLPPYGSSQLHLQRSA